MVFTIDGFNIVPFIGEDGIKWQLNALDSSDAGRAQDGTMYRGLVGYKCKCNISCLWMDRTQAHALMARLTPEYVTVVTDTIPWDNGTHTITMYSNNLAATCLTEYSDGTKLYGDVEFPLIER